MIALRTKKMKNDEMHAKPNGMNPRNRATAGAQRAGSDSADACLQAVSAGAARAGAID
jgi:hypothetical protein